MAVGSVGLVGKLTYTARERKVVREDSILYSKESGNGGIRAMKECFFEGFFKTQQEEEG